MFEGEKMVVVLSDKEDKAQKEILRILNLQGAGIISEKGIQEAKGDFSVVSIVKPNNIQLEKGVIIMTSEKNTFKNQILPEDVIGICKDTNSAALNLFMKNHIPVITCGTGNKNTLTVSSVNDKGIMISLQRNITDIKGNIIEPIEIKIAASAQDFFPLLAATGASLYYGVLPSNELLF